MKTYKEFAKEAENAFYNLMLEAKGFGGIAKKRKKDKKKKSFLSARDEKIKDLKNRPFSWQGLK